MAPIQPDFENSNTIPYALFGTYVGVTSTLIFFAGRTLREAYKSLPPSAAVRHRRRARIHQIEFYAVLALISFLSTIFFNAQILSLSYRVWAYERDPAPLRALGEQVFNIGNIHGLQWGRWLRETDLLGEFYEIVIEKSRRRWWLQQLFMAATPWSIFAVIEGQRRKIPHLWAFIGLTPLVSLPFAQSLFFLAILWTPVPLNKQRRLKDTVNPNHPIFLSATVATFGCVSLLPFTPGTGALGATLSWLSIAYFLPLAVPVLSTYLGSSSQDNVHGVRGYAMFRVSAGLALLVHGIHLGVALLDHSDPRAFWNRHSSVLHYQAEPAAWRQAQEPISKILQSATDHPSVSKVAVDSFLAAFGLFTWAYFRGLKVTEILSSIALWGKWPEHVVEKAASKSSQAVAKAKTKAVEVGETYLRDGKRRVSGNQAHEDEDDVHYLRDGTRRISGNRAHENEDDVHYLRDGTRRVSGRQSHPYEVEDEEIDKTYVSPGRGKIQEGDDNRQESTESAALSWGLSVVGGLAYLTAGVLGAETIA